MQENKLIEKIAFSLWSRMGRPEGHSEFFWNKAKSIVTSGMYHLYDYVASDSEKKIKEEENRKKEEIKEIHLKYTCSMEKERRIFNDRCKENVDFNLCNKCLYFKMIEYEEIYK
ncbi:MAG: DUF2934 domain-containing protein [Bacteroidetes bacterium]|nr:MAG: DUF2934 domain-containing protein [Bacteroidota bacterium]